MAKKLRITRKEIKQPDEFITTSVRVLTFAQENMRTLMIVGGSVVVVFILTLLMVHRSNSIEKKASILLTEGVAAYDETVKAEKAAGSDRDERLREIITVFDEVVDQYSETAASVQALQYIGQIRYDLGEYEEAAAAYADASSKRGLTGEVRGLVWQGLGYCREQMGDYQGAVESFQKIIDERIGFLVEYAYFDIARNYELGNDLPRAIETYRTILVEVPNSPKTSWVKAKIEMLGSPGEGE